MTPSPSDVQAVVRRLRVIGVGLGDPEHVTREARNALATVDVLLVPDEEERHPDLAAARRAVCDALVPADHPYRVAVVAGAAAALGVIGALDEDETTVGLLVWGDPAFADTVLRLVDELVERCAAAGIELQHDVVAGIGAPQLLAARHRVALGRDAPVHLTTADRLVDEYDPSLVDVVVTLDADLACAGLADAFPDLELYWGAHLGTPAEQLAHGRLADVLPEVRRLHARARELGGWALGTYLLRAPADARAPRGPAGFPDTGNLTDGVVSVRPTTTADWQVVRDEHNNEESLRWDFTGEPVTDEQARRRAASAVFEWRRGRAARFVIVDAATGEGAGVIGVLRLGPPGTGLVGYGVLPAYRGRGFTARALRLVSRWAFEEAGLARLELGHKVGNVASGRAAEKAGFRAEGRLSGRLPNPDGTWSDEVYYSLTRAAFAHQSRD
ncbi:GNAT family N-acetyltransferase [Terrabacter sp. NPDC080008]|uniref:GNAT family N-acetyltransferase n=1 Tax=Terrabacter sp. NPDC080008 TaxID=3155176 RepID=UPI00344DF468